MNDDNNDQTIKLGPIAFPAELPVEARSNVTTSYILEANTVLKLNPNTDPCVEFLAPLVL